MADRAPGALGGAIVMCGEFVVLVPGECSANRWIQGREDSVELDCDVVGGDAIDEVDEQRVAAHTFASVPIARWCPVPKMRSPSQ